MSRLPSLRMGCLEVQVERVEPARHSFEESGVELTPLIGFTDALVGRCQVIACCLMAEANNRTAVRCRVQQLECMLTTR